MFVRLRIGKFVFVNFKVLLKSKHKKVALVAYIPGTKEFVNLVRSCKILEESW